jgi:mannose-6-phosphate isomerase-like protein (cupin superfamily)
MATKSKALRGKAKPAVKTRPHAATGSKRRAKQQFSVRHVDDGGFEGGGLRAQFVYKDLGIRGATGGKYHAHVIRAVKSAPPAVGTHVHTAIDFQLVYILKGWMRFWYEGQGEVLVKAGACILQPPGIKHDVLEWSDDLELLEVTSPADFKTATAIR